MPGLTASMGSLVKLIQGTKGEEKVTNLCSSLHLLFPMWIPILTWTIAVDFSSSDLVTQTFKSSKTKVQSDRVSVSKKERRHLLAISSFLFAIIWGFGAHLSSRYYDNGRYGIQSAEVD